MPNKFNLNNSNDIICDKLFLLDTNNTLQDVLDLIANSGGGGGGGGGISTLTGSGSVVITGTSTSKNILVDLSMYTTTSALMTLLNSLTIYLSTFHSTDLANTLTNYTTSSALMTLLNGKVDDGQVLTNVPTNAVFTDSIYTHPSQHPISMITGLQTQLDAKQDTLTASTGVFLTGSTLSSYGLMWDTNNTTTLNIKNLHFKTGFNVIETFNLSSGDNQLDISTIADASQAWVTTQLTTKQDIIPGVSSGLNFIFGPANWISGKSGTAGASWVPINTLHSIFTSQGSGYDWYKKTYPTVGKTYILKADVKLVGSSSVFVLGTGQAGTGRSFDVTDGLNHSTYTTLAISITAVATTEYWQLGYQASYTGVQPSAGDVYHIQNVSVSIDEVSVLRDLSIYGTMTAAIKSFDIVHPDPEKPDYRLRHWCIESFIPGGMVMYTKSVEMSTTSETFNMPDWFKHLTKDVIVFVTPFKHFGSGWGECVDNELQIHTTTKGQWNILITASRADYCATTMCPLEVEYTIIDVETEMQPPPQ